MRAATAAALALLAAAPTAQERIDLDGAILFRGAEREAPFASTRAPQDIDADARLDIDVDEDALALALALVAGLEERGGPIEQRIDLLEQLGAQFLHAQAALMEYRAASLALERAGFPEQGPGRERFRAAQGASGGAALEAIEILERLEGALKDADDVALARRLRVEAGEALLGEADAYEATGRVFERELRRVNDELLRRIDEGLRVEVVMTALLADGSGGSRYLHLDGYDRIVAGAPLPYPRIEIALSARTRRELEAAESLAETVEEVLDGTLERKLEAAVEVARAELDKLEETLRNDVLRKQLERTIADLRRIGDQTLGPLIAEAEAARELLLRLETGDFPDLGAGLSGASGGARAAALTALAGSLEDALSGLIATTHDAARALPGLADRLEARIGALPGAIEQGTVDALRAAAGRLRDAPEVAAVRASLEKLRESLGLGRRIAQQAEQAGSIARRVGAGQSLDTSLDLLEAGERHPGDRLVVRVKVVTPGAADGEERVLGEATRIFRLRVIGFHLVTRGSLLFADPRTGAIVGQSWEPAPAVSWLGHWGRDGASFWNDVLDPGLGLTLSLLDFVDEDDFEVGLSASLTLFNDLLWVGYGRNVQAESDFFYVGLNPLVLGDLWRRGDALP